MSIEFFLTCLWKGALWLCSELLKNKSATPTNCRAPRNRELRNNTV